MPKRPNDLHPSIFSELYKAMERLGADSELLAIVGSIGDTLDDEEVLKYLKAYNETGTVFKNVVCG